MSKQVPRGSCLQCGQTREWVEANEALCGAEDYWGELIWELPRHRWADWSDAYLDRIRLLPELRDQHRRTSGDDLANLSCDFRTREHEYTTQNRYGPVPNPEGILYCRYCSAVGATRVPGER